ncbi:MAG: hypothetical protein HPY85_06455 [Anaerolineae bacterium]|nr:hypothetical protein [Anaerolineae bacterium]
MNEQSRKFRSFALVLGILSLVGILYNVGAYRYLQHILVPSLQVIPPAVDRITIGLALAFFTLAIYHLTLLVFTLRLVSHLQTRFFLGAFWLVLLVTSGVLILSDITILHDQGKEYIYWDISGQWNMLYGITGLHLFVAVTGLFLLWKQPLPPTASLFSKIEQDEGALFYLLHIIGLICGLAGLTIINIPELIDLADRYRNAWLLALSILAALPFVSFGLYWLIRKRGPALDEKQLADVGGGATAALLVSFTGLLLHLIMQNVQQIILHDNNYLIFLIFLQLTVYAGTVALRNGLLDRN